MKAEHTTPKNHLRPLDVIVSIFVLFVLAVAQPLLDLLGRNAEFFLARAAAPVDIVVLALVLTIVIPLVLTVVVLAIARAHAPTGRIVHGAVITLLGAILALQIIGLLAPPGLNAWVEIGIAIALGLIHTVGYYRFEPLQSMGRFAAIAPLVVLGLFLFASSTSQLIFAAPAIARPAEVSVGNPAPVVVVVFDEFPVASLMDGEGNLQEEVYPNFAKLARDGTWFRNAVTTQQQTENALPEMLSGRSATGDKIPTAADHPFTLFSLLADSYDLNVHESITDLCPEYACANETRPIVPTAQRLRTFLDDLRIVAGHLFLPAAMTTSLPSIDSSWSNFSGGEGTSKDIIARFQELTYESDRRETINQFIGSIETSGREPQLSFLHALVPHVPWDYLPSGQTSSSSGIAPGSKSPGWGDDEWLVDQGYQRHLLMAEYVDGVLGNLIDKLEAIDQYDDTLIVVVADHGVAVRPNIRHRRVVNEDTIGDIAAVPLFIKRPNQEVGSVDDYRAETADLLPTIADILEVDVPWATDGTPLFAESRPERTESTITGTEGTFVFGTDGSEARAIARRRIDSFGTQGAFGLAPPGYAGLLGTPIDDLVIGPVGAVTATLRDRSGFRDVDTNGPVLPTWVRGTIRFEDDNTRDVIVAIAVNGKISAITRSYVTEETTTAFGAMIPPDSLVDGFNDVELLLASNTGSFSSLSR